MDQLTHNKIKALDLKVTKLEKWLAALDRRLSIVETKLKEN